MRYTTRIIVPPRVRRSGLPGSPGAGPRPQALGVRKSFGFGDRLGPATPGHLAVAAMHADFAPLFAQQSIREMVFTSRPPRDVLATAARVVGNARYRQPWGADADRLQTPQDVEDTAAAGFTYFTIDLSEHVRADVDDLSPDDLAKAMERVIAEGEMPEDWSGPYLDRTIDLPGNQRLTLTLDPLRRAAVKFSRAVQHAARMSETAARANQGRPYEIEVCLDEAHTPISPSEHLFLGLELEARGVRLTSLALRYEEPLEESADFRGGLARFETTLREHAAVAEFCGPYKLGFRGDHLHPEVCPIIGRCCADALHVKTSASSYLEALRVAMRFEPGLFGAIVESGRARFGAAHGRMSHRVPTMEEVAALPDEIGGDTETAFFDGRVGRQFLDATCGPVLGEGHEAGGRTFKTAILELLDQQTDLYQELMVTHFDRQLQQLKAG